MKTKITPYLRNYLNIPELSQQYLPLVEGNNNHYFLQSDPLEEETNQPVKGLIHKYENRALIKVSYRCAAHCQFCTRIRQIGDPEGDLQVEHLSEIINYIRATPVISDVILSGGDPFYTPNETIWLLKELRKIDSVKIIRIGTRLPVHNPVSFNSKLIKELLNEINFISEEKPFYILIHFAHPAELTDQTKQVIKQLRKTGATLLSQTVFLKGINDNFDTLKHLFEELYFIGVQPYYLYRCDYVSGLENFVCDLEEEIHLATMLRKVLSGISCPTYIIDVQGKGKIPVPLNFWEGTNLNKCNDFNEKETSISINTPRLE
jgi:lysine 2,3-aminomutase